MIIRDTSTFEEAFKFDGYCKCLLFSTNFVFFQGIDDKNKPILGLINFVENRKTKKPETRPIISMPLAFFGSNDRRIMFQGELKDKH